ncbi:thioredoxin family protein [Winogradskyella sp. DF17]|uniref:Thioredoxin family protein n=1 Tax=Winogradskyella pelagia TaxID=2819984 RepID=A0ABS3SY57_9FLAO|nr:thioredoxin family protein [Winogradskyella sp. DF17]MBO3115426.1 thioredoxin family protein [Winogradskyella sp. DF17]
MKKFLFLLLLPTLILSQTVKGSFSPVTDYTYAFLYNATPDGANYVDRGKLNAEGYFEIELDSTIAPGIYKIVYAIPPEENNFDFIYDGKTSVEFKFNAESGVEFTQSDENKLWDSYLKSMEMVNQTISNYYAQGKTDEKGYTSIFKVLADTQNAYEESSKGMLVSAFIDANRPYIPQSYEDIRTYSKNLKEHYLSEIDFNNYFLQCSSFLVDRVMAYVFDIVLEPTNDTYKSHIDDVSNTIGAEGTEIKTSLLYLLWQRFVNINNHEVANYITDTYLLNLANGTNNKVIAETITSYKNTSIGAFAPNFDIEVTTKNGSTIKKQLYDLSESDYYLVIFWSSECGHCLKELPLVKDLVTNYTNIKVVAFGLENEASGWSEEIKNYPDFLHTIGLGKWENTIVKTYGITATPTYFLLDKEKKILSKPYDFNEVENRLKDL